MIDMFYFISCAIHHRFGCRRLDLGLHHYDFLCHTLQGFHIPQLLIQSHQLIQGVEAVGHDGKSLLVSLFRIFRIKYIICILLFIYFSKKSISDKLVKTYSKNVGRLFILFFELLVHLISYEIKYIIV